MSRFALFLPRLVFLPVHCRYPHRLCCIPVVTFISIYHNNNCSCKSTQWEDDYHSSVPACLASSATISLQGHFTMTKIQDQKTTLMTTTTTTTTTNITTTI